MCTGAAENLDASTKWTNLLLCCDGHQGAGADFTCDKSKEATDICADFRNPKLWTHEQVVEVNRSGLASPSAGLPADAGKVVDTVLNLNAPHLVRARQAVIGAWLRKIDGMSARSHGLTPQQRDTLAGRLRKEAETVEFGSALLTLANHLLRKNTP